MRLLPVVAGAIVPHAPLLLPELESQEVAEAATAIRKASAEIDLKDPDVVVVVSPHGRATGVNLSPAGSLRGFGVSWSSEIDAAGGAGRELAAASMVPVVEEELDYGVIVPLSLLGWEGPVVAVSFEEIAFEDAGREWAGMDVGERVARGIDAIARNRRVAVIASLNGCVGLSPRSPLTEIPETKKVEAALLTLLESDLSQLGEYAIVLTRRGRSCGLVPLRTFGFLFGGSTGRVRAHEAPVGVGYLVGEVL